MRFLGIDYGEKRVGTALSDEGGVFAFPFKIIVNNEKLLDEIHNICGEQEVKGVVIGESRNSLGKENDIMKKINNFKKEVEKLEIPVFLEKEFMTTVEARGREGKEINNARKTKIKEKKKVDDSAAALILQRYLDRKVINLKK